MKPSGPTNMPASVAARLRDRSRATGDDYQVLLTAYFFERFLFRLSRSPVSDRFVLKGAMLRLWSEHRTGRPATSTCFGRAMLRQSRSMPICGRSVRRIHASCYLVFLVNTLTEY